MAEERYVVFGFIPSEHELGNPNLNPEAQKVPKSVPIYSTDDEQEALKIVREGGFIKNDQWFAAVGAQDRQTGNKVGNV